MKDNQIKTRKKKKKKKSQIIQSKLRYIRAQTIGELGSLVVGGSLLMSWYGVDDGGGVTRGHLQSIYDSFESLIELMSLE